MNREGVAVLPWYLIPCMRDGLRWWGVLERKERERGREGERERGREGERERGRKVRRQCTGSYQGRIWARSM
jgi:hypothetical protein